MHVYYIKFKSICWINLLNRLLFSCCEKQYFWLTRYKCHTRWHWELGVNVFICSLSIPQNGLLLPSSIRNTALPVICHHVQTQLTGQNKEKLANCLWYRIYKRGNNHSKKQVVISWEILMEHFCSLLFVLLSNPIGLNMVTEDYVSVIKSKTWGRLCISNKPRQYLGYCIYYFFSPREQRLVIDYFW